jgi:molybdopterin adenylyltransferase
MKIRVGILTVSDRSYNQERTDTSGPALSVFLIEKGWEITQMTILPDDQLLISDLLKEWSDSGRLDVIITTGGTGFSARDVTPEATLSILERLAPGLPEAMRAASREYTQHAMLSRAVAGIRGKTLVINLPGSPKGAMENLQVVLPVIPHAVELLRDSPDAEKGH